MGVAKPCAGVGNSITRSRSFCRLQFLIKRVALLAAYESAEIGHFSTESLVPYYTFNEMR